MDRILVFWDKKKSGMTTIYWQGKLDKNQSCWGIEEKDLEFGVGCALSETPVYFLIIILSRFGVVFVEDVWTWAVSLRMTIKPIRLEDYHFRGGYEQRKG